MAAGGTGGASKIVKVKSSGKDPRATRDLVSNPSHPRSIKESSPPGTGSSHVFPSMSLSLTLDVGQVLTLPLSLSGFSPIAIVPCLSI